MKQIFDLTPDIRVVIVDEGDMPPDPPPHGTGWTLSSLSVDVETLDADGDTTAWVEIYFLLRAEAEHNLVVEAIIDNLAVSASTAILEVLT